MDKDPELIELRRADFVTIGTVGRPGQRTFFLQAAQDDLVVSLIIEKEQATALAIGISNVLSDAEALDEVEGGPQLELIHPVRPLFRVSRLNLGYDEADDLIVVIAEGLVPQGEVAMTVRIWATRDQMLALEKRWLETV